MRCGVRTIKLSRPVILHKPLGYHSLLTMVDPPEACGFAIDDAKPPQERD